MVLRFLTRKIAALTWVLILGGILLLGLGSVLQRSEPALGGSMVAGAMAAIVIGVVLIWVRSRMKEDDPA